MESFERRLKVKRLNGGGNVILSECIHLIKLAVGEYQVVLS